MREKMCEFKVSAMLRWWWCVCVGGVVVLVVLRWWWWGSRVLETRLVKFSKQNKMLHNIFRRL